MPTQQIKALTSHRQQPAMASNARQPKSLTVQQTTALASPRQPPESLTERLTRALTFHRQQPESPARQKATALPNIRQLPMPLIVHIILRRNTHPRQGECC